MRNWSRREILAKIIGLPIAAIAGCRGRGVRRSALPAGQIIGTSLEVGHVFRKPGRGTPSVEKWRQAEVVIVGGGVAGYSAARRLHAAGMRDFVLFELEPRPGGLSSSGRSDVVSYPWAAHYLPVPMKENEALVALLDEMDVLAGRDEFDEPIVAEPFLCRAPEERLFVNGRWQEGLNDWTDATPAERTVFQAFDQLIDEWVRWRDKAGRRAFAIPLAHCSDDPEVTQLDQISMSEWLNRHGLQSDRLRWYVDYCCRDDYGMTVGQTSAWAGIFYFASRIRRPGELSQELITWPEGNGRLIAHMHQIVADRVRLNHAVSDIIPAADSNQRVRVVARDCATDSVVGYEARCVVFAVQQFLRPYLIRSGDRQKSAGKGFEYGSWMVSNLHLNSRPSESTVPMAWDNVLHDSESLGYVVASHQENRSTGPTVITHYYPFCDENPAVARARLMDLDWAACAEIVLQDLERAHPDLRRRVDRLDVMRWGHAMIRAVPGFTWSETRVEAALPIGNVFFANSDLSGLPLFEEAFYHGNRAAEEVLAALGVSFESVLSG